MAALPEFAYLLFIIAGAAAVGNPIRKLMHKTESRLEAFLVASGIGFVAIYLVMFGLGVMKLYIPPVLITLNAGILLLILLQLKQLSKIIVPDFSWVKEASLLSKVLLTTLILVTGLNFLVASAPPTSPDALLYHLSLPKIYLESQGIIATPSLQLSSELPLSIDFIYLYAMQLLNGNLSQLTSAYLAFLATLTVFLIARKMALKTEGGLIAAVIFCTLPIYSVFNVRAYVDIGVAFFLLLSINFFLEWLQKPEWRSSILTGIFLGMALASKTTSIITAAAMGLMYSWVIFREPKKYLNAKFYIQAKTIGIIALIILAPFLAKSFMHTGNPIHPFLYDKLGGTYWNSDLDRIMMKENFESKGVKFSLANIIFYPFTLTVKPYSLADSAGITPLFLGLFFLIFILKVPRNLKLLLILTGIAAVPFFLTGQLARYMFHIWGLLSAVIAYIMTSFEGKDTRLIRSGLLAIFFAALVINAGIWAKANAEDIPVAIGMESEKDYLTKKVPTFAATEYLAAKDPNGIICWYGQGRGYWSENPYIWCSPMMQGYVDFFSMKSQEELAGRLDELGVSYILVEREFQEPLKYGPKTLFSEQTNNFHLQSNKILFNYLENQTERIFEDGNTAIYEIKP